MKAKAEALLLVFSLLMAGIFFLWSPSLDSALSVTSLGILGQDYDAKVQIVICKNKLL